MMSMQKAWLPHCAEKMETRARQGTESQGGIDNAGNLMRTLDDAVAIRLMIMD